MDTSQGSRKAVLLVLLLFILGIALGSVGTYLVTTRVQAAKPVATLVHNPAHTMAMYTRDLNLNVDQQGQIQAILSEMRGGYAGLHERLDPEYEKVRQQRPKFEELLRQIDEDRLRRQGNP